MPGTTFSEIPFTQGAGNIVAASNAAEGRRLQQEQLDIQAENNRATLEQREAKDMRDFNDKMSQSAIDNRLKVEKAQRDEIAAMDDHEVKLWTTRAKAMSFAGPAAVGALRAKDDPAKRQAYVDQIAAHEAEYAKLGIKVSKDMSDEALESIVIASTESKSFLEMMNKREEIKEGNRGGTASYARDAFSGELSDRKYGEPAPNPGVTYRAETADLALQSAIAKAG